jgi:hypothetical protein
MSHCPVPRRWSGRPELRVLPVPRRGAALDANTGKVLWRRASALRQLGENTNGKQRWGPRLPGVEHTLSMQSAGLVPRAAKWPGGLDQRF